MVSGRDRGQLLLVTAVAMAFIILGLAVLINTAVTTDVRAPDDPAVDVTEADRLAGDIDRGIAGMVARVNLDWLGEGDGDLREEVNDNVTIYSDFLFEAAGDRRGTLIDLEFEDFHVGTLVVDEDRSSPMTMVDEDGLPLPLLDDVSLRVDPDEPAPLRGVQLSFTVDSFENGNDEPGVIIYGNGGCTVLVVSYAGDDDFVITRYDEADCIDNGDLISPIRGPVGPSRTCEASGGSIVIDLGPGEPIESDCSLDAFSNRTPIDGNDGYGFALYNAEENDGGYRFIVGSGDFVGVDAGYPDPDAYFEYDDGESPYAARLVYSLTVDITQDARASERVATETVLVYDYPENVALLEVDWIDD